MTYEKKKRIVQTGESDERKRMESNRGVFGDYFETFEAKKHRRDKAFAGNADCFIFHYRRYPYGGFDSFD